MWKAPFIPEGADILSFYCRLESADAMQKKVALGAAI